MFEQLHDVHRSRQAELLLDDVLQLGKVGREQGTLQKVERLDLALSCVGRQRRLTLGWLRPAGGHGDKLLVEPCRAGSVETKPPDEHDAGDCIPRLSDAGTREVVVDEALGGETTEKRWTTRCSR